MKNKLEIIKTELMRERLRVVNVAETKQPNFLQQYFTRIVDRYNNSYVDVKDNDIIIDDLTELDMSNPCAVKKVRNYRGKYLK